jgi:hypothetical protein
MNITVGACRLLAATLAAQYALANIWLIEAVAPYIVPGAVAALVVLLGGVVWSTAATVKRVLRVAVAQAPLLLALGCALALLATAESVPLALLTVATRFWCRSAAGQKGWSLKTRTVMTGCTECIHAGAGGWVFPLITYFGTV